MNNEIREKVVDAMQSACEDMFRFTGERAKLINTEYIFTVSVAKHIDKLNNQHGDPYRIYLEKNRKQFYNDCLTSDRYTNVSEKARSRRLLEPPKIKRKQRMDIAVYKELPNDSYLGHRPFCAIELKGFDPARALVINDLKRNVHYFSIPKKTGRIVLDSTLFAALHSGKKIGNVVEEMKYIESIKNKYISWMSELPKNCGVSRDVQAHIISKDTNGEVVDLEDYNYLNIDTIHHYIGITIEFRSI